MVNADVIGPATLAITQGVGAFTTFLPRLADIRRADVSEDVGLAADVRLGEVAAVALTVGIGTITSSLTGSSVPVFVAVIVSFSLVMLYECTLRANRPMEPKTPLRVVESAS